MKLNWFFLLLSFLSFSIAGDDDGGTTDDNAPVEGDDTGGDEPQDNSSTEEPASAEEAVLEAMGLDEGKADDAPPAEGGDQAQPEGEPDAAAKKADEEAAKKGITEDDLKPLESRNKETNERFRKVTEGYRQEKERAEQLQQKVANFQQSFDALKQLGFSDETAAEDLVGFSEYRHVLATGDSEAFSKIIAEQVRQFESLHGKRVAIQASALDAHPDLKQRVEDLDLDEAMALEVARARDLDARASRERQQRTQQVRTEQEHTAVLNDAVAAVENLQTSWKKNDPDFPAILPHLQPMMQEIGAKYPPNLWPQLLELQYKSIKKALVEQGGNKGSTLPLRGNGHQRGKSAPSTPQEAVLQELGLDE